LTKLSSKICFLLWHLTLDFHIYSFLLPQSNLHLCLVILILICKNCSNWYHGHRTKKTCSLSTVRHGAIWAPVGMEPQSCLWVSWQRKAAVISSPSRLLWFRIWKHSSPHLSLFFFVVVWFACFVLFETGFHCVVQADLKLTSLPSAGIIDVPPCLVTFTLTL
jgi:hypothetical protein